jgi:hypothetical protein
LKMLETKDKQHNDNDKKINNLTKLLLKTHNTEVSSISKTKNKRKGTACYGINEPREVPVNIRKYLGLKDDEKLSRTQVGKFLGLKFKDEGLKNGRETTLNKKVVSALQLPKENVGRILTLTNFQTFLKELYDKK